MLKMQDGRPIIVPEAIMRPNGCALNAHVTRDAEGFIDTGTKLPGFEPRVYVAMSSLRELVRCLGWPTEAERDDLLERAASLEAERDQAREDLEDARGQLEAVAVLRAGGYSTAKKPGPKAKVAA